MYKDTIRPSNPVKRFLYGFVHAGRGIAAAVRAEPNMRIHLGVAVATLGVALWLHVPAVSMAVLILAIALVLAAELLNTAVEAVVDLVSPEFHELARLAKDTAAGGVLVCAVGAVGVGVLILLPRLWAWIVQ